MGQVYQETLSTDETGPEAPQSEENQVPEKFRNEDGTLNQEALLKSYTELESKLPQRGEDGKFQPQTPAPESGGLSIKAPENPQGLLSEEEMQSYMGRVLSDGDLSEEDYTALEAKGLPKALVSNYVQGLKSQQDSARAQVFNMVGGEENYAAMTNWAQRAMSEAQQNAFNNAIASGDMGQIEMAVSGLHAQFAAANGQTVVGKAGGGGNNVKPYASTAEMVKDMSDDRYVRGDQDFHAYVESRIRAGGV